MVPKLHKKGSSFAGAAAYLLHDKEAQTSHRVVWTQTRNLATNRADAAWRVMAATALDQSRLKREAGIKATGRKSRKSVLHLSLSWHPDEAATLTRAEQIAAAEGAIKALGAERHQALFVCHDDEPQPHLHILLNRISPDDGRLLSSSKERIHLSQWAEKYESSRGRIYCEERVANNAARARGNYVRGAKDRPRHIVDLEASNENREALWAQEIRKEQRAADLALQQKTEEQKQRHQERWHQIEQGFQTDKREQTRQAKRSLTIALQQIGDAYEDQFATLALEQEDERAEFAKREETLLGRGRNILKSIPWTGLLRQEKRSVAIKEAFGLLSGRVGARSEGLRRAQQRQTTKLEQEMNAAKQRAVEAEKRQERMMAQRRREAFLLERHKLLAQQTLEKAWLATEWQARKKARELAWEQAHQLAATRAFERKATPEELRQKEAEHFMARMRRARLKRTRERGKGEGKLKDAFERQRGRSPEWK